MFLFVQNGIIFARETMKTPFFISIRFLTYYRDWDRRL